jgi:Tfp pilus assembly protein PilF
MLDSFPERRPKIAEVVNRLTKCGTALPPRSEDRGKTVFEDVPPTAGHNQEKTSGGDAMAHYQAGVGFRAAGQLDQAKEEFLKALLINPNFPAAQNLLGLVFLKKGEHDMAVAAFRTCIRLKADSAEAHHNLGVALHEKKDDSAMDSFKEALRLNPDLAETRKSLAALHNNRGDVLLGQKKNRLAKQEYLEALKMNPDSAAVRKNLQTANFISFEMYWQPSLLIAFCATEIIGDLHIVPLKLSFVEYGILSLMSIAGLIGLAYMPAGKTLRHKLLRLGRALLFGSLFAWAVIILARSA